MAMTDSFEERLQAAAPRLFDLIDGYAQIPILVIGDLTLDEFLTGEVERLSREAPVLILRHEFTRQIPGGGANAIYNLAKLGGQVKAAGILGKDSQGEALTQIFKEAHIATEGIIAASDRPTVTKTRIAGHARQSVTQQVVRVDRKSDELPQLETRLQVANYVRSQLASVQAVVCSDYGDGTLTQPVIEAALEHKRVIVDTQKALERYPQATVFTPNLPEAEKAVGYGIDDDAGLLRAGEDLLNKTQAQLILITRGDDGMSLFERNPDGSLKIQHVPAFNKTDVYDVTGAGDTVVSALTLALCQGASTWDAAVLGNLAASLVVRKFGTATTSAQEMKEALQSLLEGLAASVDC
ncbi:MAG: PfkB family carbohydrate kinase [Cyanobacteria bacterium P01_H01_bin.15]